jgi:hypothetical protein
VADQAKQEKNVETPDMGRGFSRDPYGWCNIVKNTDYAVVK